MSLTPFLSPKEFKRRVDAGTLKPDALFPWMNYSFCKYVWQHSPLIAHVDAQIQDLAMKDRLKTGQIVNFIPACRFK